MSLPVQRSVNQTGEGLTVWLNSVEGADVYPSEQTNVVVTCSLKTLISDARLITIGAQVEMQDSSLADTVAQGE